MLFLGVVVTDLYFMIITNKITKKNFKKNIWGNNYGQKTPF